MDVSKPPMRVTTLECFRGEIFLLYIVLNTPARDVIEILKQKHDFNISPKVFKTKLNQWGYTKNVKRCDVLQILGKKSRQQSASTHKEYAFTLGQRPIDGKKVERYIKRAGLLDVQQKSLMHQVHSAATEIANRTSPPTHPPTSPHEEWKIPEKLLYNIDILIKGSFEAGLWSFKGNNLMIKSSTSQSSEHKVLHDFLADFAIGCHAADEQDLDQAGICWQRAFLNIEALVKGNYHEIIPNLIQKINDLNRQGHKRLAALLKEHIARCGKIFLGPETSTASIFEGLGKLDMFSLFEIEERIMKQFARLFEFYLGHQCYNSFVTMMDGARRRLLKYPWSDFNCLPDITHLDDVFGPVDRRSLDVISMRIEILSHRRLYVETEIEATTLVQRAKMIQNDDWQRFYNLTRGWYFLGSAQYFLRKRDSAIHNLSNALSSDDELCKIDKFHIFNTERMIILKYLEHLKGVGWVAQDIGGPNGGLNRPVGSLMFFRCCKEPMRPDNEELKEQL